MKWLIEEQIKGAPELNYLDGHAPWLSWGPYLWADGMRAREDGLTWACADLVTSDGTHPSDVGQRKVAGMLVDFLKSDTTARPWFVRQPAQPPPKPAPAAVVHAPDYRLHVANGSIGSIYGAELSSSVAVAVGNAAALVAGRDGGPHRGRAGALVLRLTDADQLRGAQEPRRRGRGCRTRRHRLGRLGAAAGAGGARRLHHGWVARRARRGNA